MPRSGGKDGVYVVTRETRWRLTGPVCIRMRSDVRNQGNQDMDKVFSTRIDESVADRISRLARCLRTSKKLVIEEAVTLLEFTLGESRSGGFLDQSFGAWNRGDSATETVEAAREAFRESFEGRRR